MCERNRQSHHIIRNNLQYSNGFCKVSPRSLRNSQILISGQEMAMRAEAMPHKFMIGNDNFTSAAGKKGGGDDLSPLRQICSSLLPSTDFNYANSGTGQTQIWQTSRITAHSNLIKSARQIGRHEHLWNFARSAGIACTSQPRQQKVKGITCGWLAGKIKATRQMTLTGQPKTTDRTKNAKQTNLGKKDKQQHSWLDLNCK